MRLTLRARILAAFLVALVVFVGALGYGILGVRGIGEELGRVQNVWVPLSQRVSAVSALYPEYDLDTVERLPLRTRRGLANNFDVRLRLFRNELAEAQRLASSANLDSRNRIAAQKLERLVTLLGGVTQPSHDAPQQLKLFVESIEGGDAEKVAKSRAEFLATERRLIEGPKSALVVINEGLRADAASAQAKARRSLFALAALTAAATLFGLAATALVSRALAPVGELIAGVKRISAGELGQRVRVSGGGEVALLADEFNRMSESLLARDAKLEAQSQALVRSERLAAIGRMSSQITHEVRNPLNSLSLNVEMLEEELASQNGEARVLLRAIASEIERLTQVTEGYLSYARLPKPKMDRADANAIVEGLLRFVREEAEKGGAHVKLELGKVPEVFADENQLRQALLNVVRNALDALRESKRGGTLTASTRANDGFVEIVLSDDGPGIPPQDLQRIFDPFYSTKSEGTGLGLPLTHQIIVEHGGSIACASEPGRGTTFTIRIPAA